MLNPHFLCNFKVGQILKLSSQKWIADFDRAPPTAQASPLPLSSSQATRKHPKKTQKMLHFICKNPAGLQ